MYTFIKNIEETFEFFITLISAFLIKGSSKEKILLIWIPKNLGTSIYEGLKNKGAIKYKRLFFIKYFLIYSNFITFGHFDINLLKKRGVIDVTNYKKFAVLRDPVSRFKSIYSYYKKRGIFKKNIDLSINDILDLLEQKKIPEIGLYHHKFLSMFNSQTCWLKGEQNIDYFLIENTKGIERYIKNNLNIEFKLPFLNQSQSSSILLTEVQIDRLKSIYKSDYLIIKKVMEAEAGIEPA